MNRTKTTLMIPAALIVCLISSQNAQAAMFHHSAAHSIRQTDQQRVLQSRSRFIHMKYRMPLRYNPYLSMKHMIRNLMEKVREAIAKNRLRQRDNQRLMDQVNARVDNARNQAQVLRTRQQTLLANQKNQMRMMQSRMDSIARQQKSLMEIMQARAARH